MRYRILTGLALTAIMTASSAQAGSKETPDPAILLAKMERAHGGTENWKKAGAFKFSTAMHLVSLEPKKDRNWSDSWRHYTVTLDPDTSRAFVDVPHDGSDGMEAGFDGTKLWRTDYRFDPGFQDGAMMLSWYHSSILALPFLANVQGAELTYAGFKKLPHKDGKFHKISVNYGPLGWNGSYELYLDPDTYLLAGWEQGAMTPPLPGNPVPALPSPPGKPLRVIDQYLNVDEFVIARRYVTYGTNEKPGGFHMVLDAEILDDFDADKSRPPKNAKISYKKNH